MKFVWKLHSKLNEIHKYLPKSVTNAVQKHLERVNSHGRVGTKNAVTKNHTSDKVYPVSKPIVKSTEIHNHRIIKFDVQLYDLFNRQNYQLHFGSVVMIFKLKKANFCIWTRIIVVISPLPVNLWQWFGTIGTRMFAFISVIVTKKKIDTDRQLYHQFLRVTSIFR